MYEEFKYIFIICCLLKLPLEASKLVCADSQVSNAGQAHGNIVIEVSVHATAFITGSYVSSS